MDTDAALRFAGEWVAAWNAHDIERVLSHYADDFEMTSPFIVSITGEPAGRLKGKAVVRAYWQAALTRMPDLHFELETVYASMESVAIGYRSGQRRATEVFFFNEDGKVGRAVAHYAV
jgi:ketosteroid isomerase-like protein